MFLKNVLKSCQNNNVTFRKPKHVKKFLTLVIISGIIATEVKKLETVFHFGHFNTKSAITFIRTTV